MPLTREQWAKIMEVHAEGGATMTSYGSASKARYNRVLEAKERHEIAGKEFEYGIKQVFPELWRDGLLSACAR